MVSVGTLRDDWSSLENNSKLLIYGQALELILRYGWGQQL